MSSDVVRRLPGKRPPHSAALHAVLSEISDSSSTVDGSRQILSKYVRPEQKLFAFATVIVRGVLGQVRWL